MSAGVETLHVRAEFVVVAVQPEGSAACAVGLLRSDSSACPEDFDLRTGYWQRAATEHLHYLDLQVRFRPRRILAGSGTWPQSWLGRPLWGADPCELDSADRIAEQP